jgi:tetratricopeptide (TPR) repeat protein
VYKRQLQYNGVNFYYGGSELFTQFSNGGLIWLLAWGFFGFLILKMIRRDLGKAKVYKEEISNVWLLIVLDITILFIFLSSIFAVYSVLVILLLIVMIAMRSVILEILSKGTEEKFVIKLWTANLKPENELGKSAYNINIVLTVVIICLGLGTLGLWVSKTIASAYLLKAESFYIEQNKKYENLSPSIEERQTFINSMTYYYATASKYDGNNPVMNRKTGSMYLELVGISAEKYSKDGGDSTQNAALISDVGKWKNYALDYTRKSIDTNPSIYSNWETRAQVYMGLVGMGFKDYASDSLFSLQKAAELNPLNYDLYYSEAQVYLVSGDKDSALASLTKVLGINAQHIPSLVLAGDINNQKGNTAIYESYLKAAKKILETTSQTNTDVYKEITNKLNDITNKGTTETAK